MANTPVIYITRLDTAGYVNTQQTLEEALHKAGEFVQKEDAIVWIYKCEPIRRVYRRPIAVDDLT